VAAARARLEMKALVEMMSRPETKALVERPPCMPETRTRLRPAEDKGEGEAAHAGAKDEGDTSRRR
jgi:hypothetical protein